MRPDAIAKRLATTMALARTSRAPTKGPSQSRAAQATVRHSRSACRCNPETELHALSQRRVTTSNSADDTTSASLGYIGERGFERSEVFCGECWIGLLVVDHADHRPEHPAAGALPRLVVELHGGSEHG